MMPIDGEWGVRKADGQFTGMVGMLQRNVSIGALSLHQFISLPPLTVSLTFSLVVGLSGPAQSPFLSKCGLVAITEPLDIIDFISISCGKLNDRKFLGVTWPHFSLSSI